MIYGRRFFVCIVLAFKNFLFQTIAPAFSTNFLVAATPS